MTKSHRCVNENHPHKYNFLIQNFRWEQALHDNLMYVELSKWRHHGRLPVSYAHWSRPKGKQWYFVYTRHSTGWKYSTKCRHQYLIHVNKQAS